MQKSEFSNIYNDIIIQINNLIESFNSDLDEKDIDIQKGLKEIILSLNKQKEKFVISLKELEKNQDWNIFTIAFYGETNAGKSTIIENLRIFFQEKTKQQQQLKFREIKQEIINIQDKCSKLENSLTDFCLQKEKLEEIRKENDKEKQKELNLNSEKLKNLNIQKKELEKKTSVNIWKIPISTIPDFLKNKKELNHIIICIKKTNKERESIIDKYDLIEKEAEEEIKKLYEKEPNIKEYEQYKNKLVYKQKDIIKYSDGFIIGDGRSDFTRKATRYEFEIENKTIAVLDLPGIEGAEQKIIEEILKGLQKAHVVFFITGKAAAPQKGDDKSEGTIDKIAKHLGSQTEVYSIYNKKINNILALNKNCLINMDEKKSLNNMICKMKEVLGDNFKTNISISALPSFLALADNFYNTEKDIIFEQKKEKFLQHLNKNELLSYSYFSEFIKILKKIIIEQSNDKIIVSNKNKIKFLLKDSIDEIKLYYKKLKEIYNKIDNLSEDTKINISKIFNNDLMNSLKKEKENIGDLVFKIREKIYEFIERDIDNKALEEKSKEIIERQVKIFQSTLQSNIEYKINKYIEKIKKILKDHFRYCEDFIEALDIQFETSIKSNLKTKSRINKGKLIGGLIGLGGLLTGPSLPVVVVGLVLLASLWAIISSVYSFFSKKYKKSQQREAINKVLSALSDDLEKQLDKNIKNQKIKIKDYNEKLYKKIDDSVYLLNENLDLLYKFSNLLKNLERKV